MAKNLKLNIKNAQLAEALSLSQPKKTLPKKIKKETAELPTEPVSAQEPSSHESALPLKKDSMPIEQAEIAPSIQREPAIEKELTTPLESVHLSTSEQE